MADRDGPFLPKSTWDRVEWSRPDVELARMLGVTDQAVAGQRRRRGKGSSLLTHPLARFRQWVAANARSLDGRHARAVLARFEAEGGVRMGLRCVREVLTDSGVRPPPRKGVWKPSRLDAADWRLPTSDLAAVWGVTVKSVCLRRRQSGRPATWNARGRARLSDPEYLAALRAEESKAAGAKRVKREGN